MRSSWPKGLIVVTLMLLVGSIRTAGRVASSSAPSCDRRDPCNLRPVTATPTLVDLAWDEPRDVSRFAYYEVQRKDPGASSFRSIVAISIPTIVTYRDTGLDPGALYSYRVRQLDSRHRSIGVSNTISGRLPTQSSQAAPPSIHPPAAHAPPPPNPAPAPAPAGSPDAPSSPAARTFSGNASLPGFEVPPGERWVFDPNASTTVEVTANVIVKGVLEMRPADPSVEHVLRFAGVDETRFVGGGMDPIATDVGLWVVGAGRLDLDGADKADWVRASAVEQGATSVGLQVPPAGWQVGDDIVIVPTEAPTVGAPSWTGFEERRVAAISGTTVDFGTGASRSHPVVNGRWGPEVLNLTRNVRIQGTPSGRSHIFVRSTTMQRIHNVEIRYMGANKRYDARDHSPLEEARGRYSLHFHQCGEGSRGSIVDGVVVRDGGGHSFVPHESNGITFRNTISYNTYRAAYWWDPQTPSNDVLWERVVAAKASFTPDAKYRHAGFSLDTGDRNIVRDSVAVGIASCECDDDGAGYMWPEVGPAGEHSGFWTFDNNTTHNNRNNGVFVWQNTGIHVVTNLIAYHNSGPGIDHGAYVNAFRYVGGSLYGNLGGAIALEAVSPLIADGARLEFQDIVMDGAALSDALVQTVAGNGVTDQPTLFRGVTMRGYRKWAFHFERPPTTSRGAPALELADIVDSDLGPRPFWMEDFVNTQSLVRVQQDGTAFRLSRSDRTGAYVAEWNARKSAIAPFVR